MLEKLYPDTDSPSLLFATEESGIEMIPENGLTVPAIMKEARLWLERY